MWKFTQIQETNKINFKLSCTFTQIVFKLSCDGEGKFKCDEKEVEKKKKG